jgi:hypothetical protein
MQCAWGASSSVGENKSQHGRAGLARGDYSEKTIMQVKQQIELLLNGVVSDVEATS